MKKQIALLLSALLLCVPVLGCGQEAEQKSRKIKIGVTLYDQYDTFLSGFMEAFEKRVAEKRAEGYEISVDFRNAARNQITQNEQVSEMIRSGCEVICVNLVDRTAPTEIIEDAKRKDVPIIFFNRELVEEDLMQWNKLYYVGANALESGVMQGELAAEDILGSLLPEASAENGEKETAPEASPEGGEKGTVPEAPPEAGEQKASPEDTEESPEALPKLHSAADRNGDGMIQYIVLEGEAGHQDAIVRSESSVNTLIDRGVRVDKLGYAIANWNRAEAQTKMTQLYSEFGSEIELVLANNDDMALGAIDAFSALGVPRGERPWIYGIDGTRVGLEALERGDLSGTVYNDKEGQAEALFELAYRLAREEPLEGLPLTDQKYIRLPYTPLRKEDVGNFRK